MSCNCGFGSPGSGGGGAGPANPTAQVGLAVVNGAAATFMRSDAAPPLDQGIAPIWTAIHKFSQLAGGGAQLVGTLNTGELVPAGGFPAPPVGANPSASVGLAAVNGVAATFMRSDAAPPLSQAIVPTWTGAHTFQQLAGVGSRMVVTDAAGLLGAAALPSAPPVGANPSASVGLAAVNGVAATFMRSDGAPALSQAIVPTWTGAHIFTQTLTDTKNMAGFGGPTAGIVSSAAVASYGWVGTGGAADEKYWTAYSNGAGWILGAVDDANTTANPVINVGRTGMNITSIAWGDATTLHNYAGSIQVSKKTQKLVHALAIAAGLIAVDASAGDELSVDMSANATLSNPTNPPPAGYVQTMVIAATQTAGGSHTLAYGTAYRFPGGVAPVLSTADGTVDYLAFKWKESVSKWDYVGQAFNFL